MAKKCPPKWAKVRPGEDVGAGLSPEELMVWAVSAQYTKTITYYLLVFNQIFL